MNHPPYRPLLSLRAQKTLRRLDSALRIQSTLHRWTVQFRLEPMLARLPKHRRRAGEKDSEQQPAADKTNPGMPPGHFLSEMFFH
jgi:hypothetical protein